MLRILLVCVFGLMAIKISASCDFITAEYLTELNEPSTIKKIEVRVPKSAKFSRNFTKILISKSKNIPPNLKKNFKAIVIVEYDFGSCRYQAKVKQNGDWKDHIRFEEGGKPLRSLNVKLKEGNILNAVKFKLLLPETRNDINEVLATVFMRKLGFISPETFQVKTVVNGVSAVMLFQEDLRKELLERNGRREGPLFEGDESLLWSFEDFENFELESLALSRLSNDKWFLKGDSSQQIALSAYSQLQKAYLDYSQNIDARVEHILFPNNRLSPTFENYFFALIAMNGMHALRPHNRRFYYNSFTSMFEPVYYDGNIEMHKKVNSKKAEGYLAGAFLEGYQFPYKADFLDDDFKVGALAEFKDRLVVNDVEATRFFEKAMLRVNKSIKNLQAKLDIRQPVLTDVKAGENDYDRYEARQKSLDVVQKNLTQLIKTKSGFNAFDQNGQKYELTANELSEILSDNELKKERFSLFSSLEGLDQDLEKDVVITKLFGGDVLHSVGLILNVDADNKSIVIRQKTSTDWILFRGVQLQDWSILLNGSKENALLYNQQAQRFNRYGMTGCLNFYQTNFDGTRITALDGTCEDSVNVVNSKGKITSIEIERAYADAIDMDFSQVDIETVHVKNAGNDCFDVSGGRYTLKNVVLSDCSDKGISVGERSQLSANDVDLKRAFLGVSSKDFSDVLIKQAVFEGTKNCYEVAQKKQEFGGARLSFGSLSCDGGFVKDKNSIIKRGE